MNWRSAGPVSCFLIPKVYYDVDVIIENACARWIISLQYLREESTNVPASVQETFSLTIGSSAVKMKWMMR
jgi:hypothetical protein